MYMRLLYCWITLLTLLLLAAADSSWADELVAARIDAGDARSLLCATSDEHLWLVRPPVSYGRDGDQPRLLHHAMDMAGPYFSRGPVLSRMPEAIAAHGDRVWVVFPPEEVAGEMRRRVHTVRMMRDPAMGMYQPDRLALSEVLPGWGRLAGFAAGEGGPMALLVPLDHETLDVRRDGRQATHQQRSSQLWQLRNERWLEVSLPEQMQLRERDAVEMVFSGEDRSQLNMLIVKHATGHMTLAQRNHEGQWSQSDVVMDAGLVRSLTSTGERLAVVTTSESKIALAYVRPSLLLSLVELDTLPGRWCIGGMRDGFRLIRQISSGELAMQRIDGITGSMSELEVMSDQPLPAARLWHTGLMLAVSVVAVLIVLLVRPGTRGAVQLPKHTAVVPAIPRLVALLIDLLPGGVLAVLILRVPPAELLRIPMLAETIEQAGPHLLMLGFTFLHCTLVELLTGTTLGKMLIGAGVASADGSQPTVGQVLIRNAVKLMVLIVPPLAIFALLNPYMQGFNDMAARTVVLRGMDEVEERSEE